MGKIVVVTGTMYKSLDEVRARLAIETLELARAKGYPVVMTDRSPQEVQEKFISLGANVFQATGATMGEDRRQAIQEAVGLVDDEGAMIWLEPEKTSLVNYLDQVAEPLFAGRADLVVPRRRSLDSHPVTQQHAEWLGNKAFELLSDHSLDMWFGVRAFRKDIASYFLEYRGEYGDRWDLFFVPVLRIIKDGKRVAEVVVDYQHPREQALSEEGDKTFDKKRFEQLKVLVDALYQEAQKLGLYQGKFW